MKALFVHSHKFKKNKDNYFSEGQFSYQLWEKRYLRYFDEIYIASRVESLIDSSESKNISNGPGVIHIELPDMARLKNQILKRNKCYSILKSEIISKDIEVIIARIPSNNGLTAIQVGKDLNKKVIVEMVGDPFDALWNHGDWKGKVLAPLLYLTYKQKLKDQDNIIFVTKYYLQNKYKPNFKNYNTINISNVDISIKESIEDIQNIRSNFNPKKDVIKIALIGSYASKYKGIDTAIETVSILKEKYNVHAELSVLGPGNKERYSKQIINNDLVEKIKFAGTLRSGEKVLEWLDSHDFYIQPSLTEGLPRGLIEAMGRGIPAIATNVGGIPELLREDALVNTRDSEKIAQKISELISNEKAYMQHSNFNFLKAKEYDSKLLQAKRDEFYKKILEE